MKLLNMYVCNLSFAEMPTCKRGRSYRLMESNRASFNKDFVRIGRIFLFFLKSSIYLYKIMLGKK